MNKQTGIWIDLRNAYIIQIPFAIYGDEDISIVHINSEIEESAATGGTRSKTPWGPQGGDVKRAAQERRHQEEKDFFESVIEVLRPESTELVIFGPSEAKHGLANAIEGHKDYKPEITGILNADQMTQNQMVAWVRKFFNHPAPRRLPNRS
jgi:hypothetical protein